MKSGLTDEKIQIQDNDQTLLETDTEGKFYLKKGTDMSSFIDT